MMFWMNVFWCLVVVGLIYAAWRGIIKADEHDQKIHDAWYESPDRVWNYWKKEK